MTASRYRVIRNPAAGIANALSPGGGSADALRALLERHGLSADVVEPEDEESARDRKSVV